MASEALSGGTPFEEFQADDAVCRQWALQQTGTTPNEAGATSTVTGAAVGTAVGAAYGVLVAVFQWGWPVNITLIPISGHSSGGCTPPP